MLTRITCPCCQNKPVAINYYKYGKVYYRNKCSVCYGRKKKPAPPGWLKSGYKKKERCEKCGFKFKFLDQASVHHVDGNEAHNEWINLKTVCANCLIEMQHSPLQWKPTGIVPDR